MKHLIFFAIVILSSVFISGCKFTERVFYEHEPSKEFYRNYDIDAPELQQFVVDDILFVVDVKLATHEKYFVWLGLYSEHKGKIVDIKRAAVSNKANEENTIFDSALLIDEPAGKAGLYQNPLKLFELGEGSLGGVSGATKTVLLKVYYEINGEKGVMNYELKRQVEKHNVYPT